MVKDKIAELIRAAIKEAIADGALPELVIPDFTIERTLKTEIGDYSTNAAIKLRRAMPNVTPIRLAEMLKKYLKPVEFLAGVEVSPPGFLNFRLSNGWLQEQVNEIISASSSYGNINLGKEQRVLLEYVSANPTGPITISDARGAALGDTLANLMTAAGYSVEREYYVNDAAGRLEAFYANCWYYYQRLLGSPVAPPLESFPEAEYAAKLLVEEYGDAWLELPEAEGRLKVGALGVEAQLNDTRNVLEKFGITFDTWYREQSLFDNDAVKEILSYLKQRGHVTEREGAIWFTSGALGQEKDNVLFRSNGSPTYFISDIAYHYNKFVTRRFDRAIDIWKADHQGHISRLNAALLTLGLNPDDLSILVLQSTSAKGDKNTQGSGNILLKDALESASPDALRFSLISQAPDTKIELDLNQVGSQTEQNPVYQVQKALALSEEILALPAVQAQSVADSVDVTLLEDETELELIRHLISLPEVIESAVINLEPHRLHFYALELAQYFHAYHNKDLSSATDNQLKKAASFKLVQAYRITLDKVLNLIGLKPSVVL